MATDNLIDLAPLDDLASEIQSQAQRIISLAQAIDDQLDHWATHDELERASANHCYSFVGLLKDTAEKAKASGEQIEIYLTESRRAGR